MNINNSNVIIDECDNVSNFALSTSSSRPRGLKINTFKNPLVLSSENIGENDDERERAIKRRKLHPSSATSSYSNSTNRSLIIPNDIAKMLPAQVHDGIAQCIKMNTKNKINAKNAFSLNIIDFMMYMVKKDTKMETLEVATSALDISTKVYSLRIDSLHHNVLSMIDSLVIKADNSQIDTTIDNNNDNNNDDYSERENSQLEKKKKKKKNQTRLTSLRMLQGNVETVNLDSPMIDIDFQTHVLLQLIIPLHCGFGLQLHLHNDIFHDNCDNLIDNYQENMKRIKWPMVQIDDRAVIDSTLVDFGFLDESSINTDDVNDILFSELFNESNRHPMIDGHSIFDSAAGVPYENEYIKSNVFYNEAIDVDEDIIDNIQDRNDVGGLIGHDGQIPHEYSFLQNPVNIMTVGSTHHWKVKRSMQMKRPPGGGLVSRKERRKELTFDDDTENVSDEIFSHKVKGKLRVCTWRDDKTILCDNDQYKTMHLNKFYLRPEDNIEFTMQQSINAAGTSELMGKYMKNMKYCDVHINDNNNDNVDNLNVENFQSISNGQILESDWDTIMHTSALTQYTEIFEFTGNNLAEIPKLTQTIQISSHIRRAKRINIQKLKWAIWRKILMINSVNSNSVFNDENLHENIRVNGSDINISGIMFNYKPIKFSQLYEELPELLSNRNNAALSISIVWITLLQLANEKNLHLISTENHDDALIFLQYKIIIN